MLCGYRMSAPSLAQVCRFQGEACATLADFRNLPESLQLAGVQTDVSTLLYFEIPKP